MALEAGTMLDGVVRPARVFQCGISSVVVRGTSPIVLTATVFAGAARTAS